MKRVWVVDGGGEYGAQRETDARHHRDAPLLTQQAQPPAQGLDVDRPREREELGFRSVKLYLELILVDEPDACSHRCHPRHEAHIIATMVASM